MAGKKIKVEKKRVARTEEIVGAFDQLKAWTEENQVLVSAMVVILLLAPLGFWGFGVYRQAKEEKAGAAYAQAIRTWPDKSDAADAKVWEEIVSGLRKCVADHSGTKAGLDAELDLAKALFQMGSYEEAAEVSGKLVEHTQPGDAWRLLARYQLAQSYEMLGKTDEALATWEALLREERVSGLKREADWRLAAIYMKKEQYAKAIDHYGEALNAPGGYPSGQQLQEELASAKMQAGPAEESEKEKP